METDEKSGPKAFTTNRNKKQLRENPDSDLTRDFYLNPMCNRRFSVNVITITFIVLGFFMCVLEYM